MPYIGNSPGTGTRNRFIYTATASQTTFSGADDNGKTLKYADSDYVDVYLNGICLVPVTDYTSTSKTSIVLTQAASLNDTLEVVAYDIATISDTVSKANGGTFEGDLGITSASPDLTFTNSTSEDTDGGRESTLTFKGKQSGGEESTLAQIQVSHDGTSDDEKGDLIFKTNDGSDGSSPTEAMRIDSAGNVGIGGAASSFGSGVATLQLKGLSSGKSAATVFRDNGGTDVASIFAQNDTTYGLSIGTLGATGDFVRFHTGALGTERMRINDDGLTIVNDGHGLNLNYVGATLPAKAGIFTSSTAHTQTAYGDLNIKTRSDYGGLYGIGFFTASSNNTPTLRARIEPDGDVKINATSNPMPLGEQRLTVDTGAGSRNGIGVSELGSGYIGLVTRPSANHTYYAGYWLNDGGSPVGSISVSNTATTYSTSSDYRLKENVTDVTDGITRVKQLAPKRFNFIADADTTVDGFLAHEAQTVVPEAVTGTHDGMRDEEYEITPAVEATFDEEGNILTEAVDAVMGTRSVPDYQGIDQAKLVPLLTAALQEAIAKIETLETKVAALEAG